MEKLNFLKIKKWNVLWVLLTFVGFRALKELIHQFANIGEWLKFITSFTVVSGNKGLMAFIEIIKKHVDLVDEASYPFGLQIGSYVVITILGYGVLFALMFLAMKINDMEYKDEDTYPWDLLRFKGLQIAFTVITIAAIAFPVVLSAGGIFNSNQIYASFVSLDFVFGNMLMYIFLLNYLLKKVKIGIKARIIIPSVLFVVVETVMYAASAVGLKMLGRVGHEFITPVTRMGDASLKPITELVQRLIGENAMFEKILSFINPMFVAFLFVMIVIALGGLWIYSGTQNMLFGVLASWLTINYTLIALQSIPRNLLSLIILLVIASGILVFPVWALLSLITTLKRKNFEE